MCHSIKWNRQESHNKIGKLFFRNDTLLYYVFMIWFMNDGKKTKLIQIELVNCDTVIKNARRILLPICYFLFSNKNTFHPWRNSYIKSRAFFNENFISPIFTNFLLIIPRKFFTEIRDISYKEISLKLDLFKELSNSTRIQEYKITLDAAKLSDYMRNEFCNTSQTHKYLSDNKLCKMLLQVTITFSQNSFPMILTYCSRIQCTLFCFMPPIRKFTFSCTFAFEAIKKKLVKHH